MQKRERKYTHGWSQLKSKVYTVPVIRSMRVLDSFYTYVFFSHRREQGALTDTPTSGVLELQLHGASQ